MSKDKAENEDRVVIKRLFNHKYFAAFTTKRPDKIPDGYVSGYSTTLETLDDLLSEIKDFFEAGELK